MARRSIFRQSALERLASPEELDALLGVTARKPWLVAAAAVAVVAVGLLWWLVDAASAAPPLG
jgi:HlyD family secretion protein